MARPRKFDETAVMEAVRKQFNSNGFAATSLDDLMNVTGLGKGSLYGAFGDKRQLFLRIFDAYCADALVDARTQLAGDDVGAMGRLRAYFREAVAEIGRDTANRGCLLSRATAELSSCEPEVAARSLATYHALAELYTESLRQAQRHGDLRPDGDPAKLGAMLLVVYRGVEALGKAGMEEAKLREIVETTLALL